MSGVNRLAPAFRRKQDSGRIYPKPLKSEQRNPMLVFVFVGRLFRFSVNTPAFAALLQLPPRLNARFSDIIPSALRHIRGADNILRKFYTQYVIYPPNRFRHPPSNFLESSSSKRLAR